MRFLVQAFLLYFMMLGVAAFLIWQGPGFASVNGQMVFLFCLVAGVPAALKTAWNLS